MLNETLPVMNGRHSGDNHQMRVTALVCDGTVPSHPFWTSHCLSALKVIFPAARQKDESTGSARLSFLARPYQLRHSNAVYGCRYRSTNRHLLTNRHPHLGPEVYHINGEALMSCLHEHRLTPLLGCNSLN
jgi:hypothetical protein